ncbi:MAG: elongation factor P maturation arginine rhamnosyltransferase EarP [Spirochaetales bacterium]|nr:elongation factor P maturation arginine rhamnosyltransferase EarP [Spirochaetales bacterium]
MTIDILCKVVDNYGDAGVVLRLARALSELPDPPRLRVVTDGPEAFRALGLTVDAALPVQPFGTLPEARLYAWGGAAPESATTASAAPASAPSGSAPPHPDFVRERPRIVLECFACGRPPWLDGLLFDATDQDPRLVVNLEHLSAEPWTVELHRMLSATRSGLVRKRIFMPGFADGTGGLVIDRSFREALGKWRPLRDAAALGTPGAREALAAARADLARRAGIALPPGTETALWVPLFSYEHDYRDMAADFSAFARENGRDVCVLAAPGRSTGSVRRAFAGCPEGVRFVPLPFLPQETWDELVLAGDFPIVRGEDSWARAALGGAPFLWHAYLQDGAHQQVKVRAFLDTLEPFALATPGGKAFFPALATLYLAFNERFADSPEAGGAEGLLPVLRSLDALRPAFRALADSLSARGDLAAHLMTFLGEIV